MKYSSQMTSKGQVTIPVEIRRKLGLKPGQVVSFDMTGDTVKIDSPDWRKELAALHVRVREHFQRHSLKPLTDEELDEAINRAGEQAALARSQRGSK